jgi:hypothetical protein
MSGFPNLMASQVIVQRIAGNPASLDSKEVGAVLYLLEKKEEQLKMMKEKRSLLRVKKIFSEMLFFPGCLLTIILVVILDAFFEIPVSFEFKFNFRLLYLIFITPVSFVNAVRQTLKWMGKYEKI